jgi:hypothetical protein
MVSMRGVKGFENSTLSGIEAEINKWLENSYSKFREEGNKFAMVEVKFQYQPGYSVSGATHFERIYAMVTYEVDYKD